MNGIRHEDLQNTSFLDNTFDIVISSEVFEHIPDPYIAFAEVYRILKPGGAHVFTVPFVLSAQSDIIMSRLDRNGTPVDGPGLPPHYVPPLFHLDPLRAKGILVLKIFGQEMITKVCLIGFNVETLSLQNLEYGVAGTAIVCIAWK